MRTEYCGLITEAFLGHTINLFGWVHRRRDHGGIIFIDLRDREGLIQVVCDPTCTSVFKDAELIVRNEFCLQITGIVRNRPLGTINFNLISGKIEVLAYTLKVLNSSIILPFSLDENNVAESMRLMHRVIDLRRPKMQNNLRLRYKVTMEVRKFLDTQGFIDIETPMLTKSTPEGARDYLVPSRIQNGEFFALPQSPQLFKQLLMVANFDRYYQITKCFRDEDLRADRQPEFTQIDCEVSFLNEKEIRTLFEMMIRVIFKNVLNTNLPDPFPIIDFSTAINKYGSDKPDMRIQLEFSELTDIMKNVTFKIFSDIANSKNGRIVGLCVPGGASLSRSDIEEYTQFVKIYGAKGLAFIKVNQKSKGRYGLQSPILKNIHDLALVQIMKRTKAKDGDLILFCADKTKIVNNSIGALRVKIGKSNFGKKNNLFKDIWCPIWVINFPMFEYNSDNQHWTTLHHPFTAPKDGHEDFIQTDPGAVIAKAYDIVLNGWELGGGSVRIHNADIQNKVFQVLKIDHAEAQLKFGFLLNALQYGAPPHGGIAFGLDRLITIMAKAESIRDVIAFPKTQSAQCLLTQAPSPVNENQLKELHINLNPIL